MSIVIAPPKAESAGRGQLAALYRTVSELFLYPEDRRAERIAEGRRALAGAPAALRDPIEAFLAAPRATDLDEYLTILELSPPCPLYLGAYLFDEPKSCLGAGLSSRNGYMLEVAATYRHFGFELGSKELADFIPAMAEFLAISLEQPVRDRIGLRRRFVETYFQPGLKPMREALAKFESPYGLLVTALEAAVDADRLLNAAEPLWVPPARAGQPPAGPIFTYRGRDTAVPLGGPK